MAHILVDTRTPKMVLNRLCTAAQGRIVTAALKPTHVIKYLGRLIHCYLKFYSFYTWQHNRITHSGSASKVSIKNVLRIGHICYNFTYDHLTIHSILPLWTILRSPFTVNWYESAQPGVIMAPTNHPMKCCLKIEAYFYLAMVNRCLCKMLTVCGSYIWRYWAKRRP